MTKIPRRKFNYGARATEGDIPPLEITEVQPILDQLAAIRAHLLEAWPANERAEADAVLRFATCALGAFQALNDLHREHVLRSTELFP